MTILFAVMAVALFAFLALTIDGGLAFSHRRSMQNAADAGSLAGTRQLANRYIGNPVNNNDVYTAVVGAAVANGWNAATGAIKATYITTDRTPLGTIGEGAFTPWIAPPPAARGVEVSAVTTYSTFFAGFIGFDQLRSQADARSIFGYACSAECLMPISVFSQTLSGGAQYIFDGDNTGPGQFGWLQWSTSPGAGSHPTLCDNLTYGNCASGPREVNSWIPGKSGSDWGSCTEPKVEEWVGKTGLVPIFGRGPGDSPGGPHCGDSDTKCEIAPEYCVAQCGGGGGGNYNYHVVGFAAFTILGADKDTRTISGTFQHMTTNAELKPGCDAKTGVLAINLIR